MSILREDLDAGRVDLSDVATGKRIPPVHPGKLLKREFLVPMGISAYRLAKDTGVPANRISEIMAGRRDISEDTALRLGLYFDMEPQFWLNLQMRYSLEVIQRKQGARLRKVVRPFAMAV